MSKNIFTLLLLFSVLCSSCKNKEEDITKLLSEIQPKYDSNEQFIYFKEKYNYDIREEIDYSFNFKHPGSIDLVCNLSFFYYGGSIKLLNYCIDDCFVSGLGTINYVHPIDDTDRIMVSSKEYDNKYGIWAIADLSIRNDYISNVFVTPLAMKALNKE